MPPNPPMPIITEPNLRTERLGGLDAPDADALRSMHQGNFILRARDGQLTQVPVAKALLPHSNRMSPQSCQVDVGPDGTVYVRQTEVLCTSSDGGRSWQTTPIDRSLDEQLGFHWKVLRDGTFISIDCTYGPDVRDPAIVRVSSDRGRTWTRRAQIPIDMNLPDGQPYEKRYSHRGLGRLQDDTLLWTIDIRDNDMTGHGCHTFRSTDGGHSWQGPILMHDFGSEGASTLLPSGRVFATLRYQRYGVDGDRPDMDRLNRGAKPGKPWKNVFLLNSDDGGLHWSTPRQLTTVFGQPFGYPAALSDGTVVVIHDTRYGPGPPGSRAMISRDEGATWEDEVYYLDSTTFTGSYSASVVLEDQTILSICGSSQKPGSWDEVADNTDLYAIRWRPLSP